MMKIFMMWVFFVTMFAFETSFAATITAVTSKINPRGSKVLWETMTVTNNVGSAISNTSGRIRSVQIIGTFGGSTVVIQGSNDGGTTYNTLKDRAGNAVSCTSACFKDIHDTSQLLRPSTSGGTADDVDVHLVMAD